MRLELLDDPPKPLPFRDQWVLTVTYLHGSGAETEDLYVYDRQEDLLDDLALLRRLHRKSPDDLPDLDGFDGSLEGNWPYDGEGDGRARLELPDDELLSGERIVYYNEQGRACHVALRDLPPL